MTKLSLVEQIDQCLPQTQCTRCGYPSCQAYAHALAAGEAEINQCPPGGEAGIERLAQVLKRPVLALNPKHGEFKPRQLAVIDEDACIGCTLCIKACPVDAIIGANKMMHTVLTNECSGCDLCLPVCPVDCITMVDDPNQNWDEARQNKARISFDARELRRNREREAREQRLREQAQLLKKVQSADLIADIMAKAKSKLNDENKEG